MAKVNITPELPIWLSGYASRNKPAATKHDDLWAKALVIEDAAGHRAVLVTMDLVGIRPRAFANGLPAASKSSYKLPRAAIALSTSHTHSGPVVRGNLMAMYSLDEDQARRVKEYKAKLADKLVDVVGDAIESLKPAKLSWGIGEAGFRRQSPQQSGRQGAEAAAGEQARRTDRSRAAGARRARRRRQVAGDCRRLRLPRHGAERLLHLGRLAGRGLRTNWNGGTRARSRCSSPAAAAIKIRCRGGASRS